MDQDSNRLWKILLIGDSGVGKSCLILRYTENTYTESYISNIGGDFKIKTIDFLGETIKMEIWDLPRQERLSNVDNDSLLRFRNHGIVIVYDINEVESFNNVKQWLKKIDRYACEIVPKLLVGNKLDADGEGKREVPYEMAKEFADDAQMDFIEVSAKDGTNVDECFLKLAENIMKNSTEPSEIEPSEIEFGAPKRESAQKKGGFLSRLFAK